MLNMFVYKCFFLRDKEIGFFFIEVFRGFINVVFCILNIVK